MLRLILNLRLRKAPARGAALLALVLLGWLLAPAEVRAQGEGDLRRVAALLDYVAVDYAHAVGPAGEVLSAVELDEQEGFIQDAARELRAGAGQQGEDLARRLDSLGGEVHARRPPAQIAPLARALRSELAERFRIALLPVAAPDLARGSALYLQACAACHGVSGHPPPPELLELSTPATAFADPEAMKPLSPQRIFSASTYGVPKTAMPAYDTALDDAERWDLAFYVLTLAHPAAPPEQARGLLLAQAALLPTGFRSLASVSDEALAAQLNAAGISGDGLRLGLAALRGTPPSEEAAAPGGLAPVRRDLVQIARLLRQGDREAARRAAISAYLDHFEPREPGLRARDAQLVQQIEQEFIVLRVAIDKKPPGGEDPEGPIARLDALLERADAVGPGGGAVAFFAALAIALREGVEAALLVAALLALLRKANRARDTSAVHLGLGAALLAGAGTWFASGALLRLGGAQRELTEGILQLVTAALLLYASHWLLAASSARRLVGFLKQKTLSGASGPLIFLLAFGAIYREMFEVVIFFRGLLLEAPGAGHAVLAGALLGLALLAVLVVLFQRLGRRLQPRPLLIGCGILLCGLAVLMVGKGVRALQETGTIPLTVWGGFQLPSVGFYSTREGIVAQALVLAGLVGSALWTVLRTGKDDGAKGSAAAAA